VADDPKSRRGDVEPAALQSQFVAPLPFLGGDLIIAEVHVAGTQLVTTTGTG
jgi:hypothetical protein